MNPQEIGRMVRFHRKKAALSQEQLAFLADVGKTVIFDIEKGKLSVQLDTLWKVLRVLNIRLDFQGPLMSLFKEVRENEEG